MPLLDDQRPIKPAIRAGAEHVRQHFERLAFAGLGRRSRRREIVAADARLLDPGVGQRHRARRLLHRLSRPLARRDLGARGNLAVGLLRVGLDLVGRHVAGDNHDGVVRRVEAPVERQRIIAVEVFDLGPPADHRTAIGMIEIKRGVHLLGQAAVRIVGDPHVLLFEHDVEFGAHDLVGEHEAGDAIGLERHHLFEMLARHALKEAGIVAGGEGVLLAADRGDLLREAGCRDSARCL